MCCLLVEHLPPNLNVKDNVTNATKTVRWTMLPKLRVTFDPKGKLLHERQERTLGTLKSSDGIFQNFFDDMK